MNEESFSLDDDGGDDNEQPAADEKELSQHPETVARRKRRRKSGGSKKRSTPRRAPSAGEVTQRLRESIAALADSLTERDPELSRILKRDGPKMADLLGKWGDHPKTPPPVKVAVVAIAEVLEPLRAFGATARLLLRRLRERRQREPELEPEHGDELAWSEPERPTLDEQPERPTPPSRFRVDAEPPDVN